MSLSKCALFLLLSSSVLAANTVCACSAVGSSSNDTGSMMEASEHAHHAPAHAKHGVADGDQQDRSLTISCADFACEGCDLDLLNSERHSEDTIKKVDVGVFTTITTSVVFPMANVSTLATTDPPLRRATPTKRFDVSLK